MATTIYWNDNGTPTPFPVGGGSGASEIKTEIVRSINRDSIITAGSNYSVPNYIVGNNSLEVYMDGLLACKGAENQYEEVNNSNIKFNDDIPTSMEITIIVRKLG